MYRIIDGQGLGKTSRLMLLAKENNGILVCSNPRAMKEKAKAYGLSGFDIIAYEEFFDRKDISDNFFIDEIESFLRYVTNNKIKGYTLTIKD